MKKTSPFLALICLATPSFAQDWSGFYLGGALSHDAITIQGEAPDPAIHPDGAGFGLFAGYNIQSGNMVFGAELAAAKHSGEATDGNYMQPATTKHSLSLRGRIGFAAGKVMPYLALGATRTAWKADHNGSGFAADMADETATGTSVALGIDWSLNDRSFLRLEVERTRYGQDLIIFDGGSDPHEYEMDATRVSVGYAIRF